MRVTASGHRVRAFINKQRAFLSTVTLALLAITFVWHAANHDISTVRAAFSFTPGNVVVYRVGDGGAALASTGTAVFLDEYTPAGALVQSVPLPTAASGANKRLVASGTATSEGLLSLSADGRYLVAAGYDGATGSSVTGTTSNTVNRVIGRIDSAGNIDTTTALADSISPGNPRSAASTNGTDLWINYSAAGVRYATLGSTSSVSVSTAPTNNLRAANVFSGQLYTSSASSTIRVATVGTGTPTTTGQTMANIPGLSTSTGSPYGFYFVHLSSAPGTAPDTVYVADDGVSNGGLLAGVQKYSLVGGSWVANGGATGATVRGVVASVNSGIVTIYAIGQSNLYTFTDGTGFNGTMSGALTSIATPGTNKAFRGIAFAPTSGGPPPPSNPSGTGSASPNPVLAGATSKLTVAVTPGANPTSTGLSVTANLTSIGGAANQQLFDDGTNGDTTAGDNTFSFTAVVDGATSAGAKTLPVTITDAQARTGSATIGLTISSPSTSPTATGSASPTTSISGGTTLLRVTVTPGTNPASSGISVTGNLSSIGGSSTQQFFDDGTHGDSVAGDNVFSFQAVATGSGGAKSLGISVSDAQSRTASTSISFTILAPPPPNTVKISQAYGGGGNSGATYTNDFIEIFNNSSSAVDISGWSVQVAGGTATTWAVTPVCPQGGCMIQPYRYFLIQESAGAGGTTAPPTPDATGTITVSSTSGKVALVASIDPLAGGCPTGGSIVDFVGYSSAATCSETSPTPALTNTTSAVRKNNGCVDTDNNAADFLIIGPIPRNSASPDNFCGAAGALSAQGLATPNSTLPASNTLLTVAVTPGTTPASTGVAVVADLTSIGGNSSQPFYDDGTHGDATAGDGLHSFAATVSAASSTGLKSSLATITDSQARSATAPITLTVVSPTCGVERWSVKVGTDADASLVDLNNPINTTIAALRSIPPPPDPPGPPDNQRVLGTENHVYVINGTMTLYKLENDVDYHVVIQDEAGRTMVVEIPNPACIITSETPRTLVAGPFTAGITAARQKFDARFTATTFFQTANIPVQIKGVAFFDFIHGQTGVAPNGIELHPVLEVNFTGATTTTLGSNINPSQFGQSITLTANVANTGSVIPTGTVTFQDGGNPIGTGILDAAGNATLNTTSLSVGSHTLRAVYEGDSASAPSTSSPFTQQVNPADQTISFPAIAPFTWNGGSAVLNAAASSGLPVTYTVLSGPCGLSGNTLTASAGGSCVVAADQAGNGDYNAAPQVTQTATINRVNQTVSLGAIPNHLTTDAPFTLSASATSGGPVTFIIVSGPATVSGNTITLTRATGTVVVQASQAGDGNYNPASATTSFVVAAPTAQLIASATVTNTGSGYVVNLTIKNSGNATANSVQLITAQLGTTAGTPLPQSLGTINSFGGTASTTVNFPASVGAPGTLVAGKFTVTSSVGTFSTTLKITLPN